MSVPAIRAADLREAILSGGEFALLDVREAQHFVAAHILTASNAPMSRLELVAPRLVPRRAVRIVLCDGGDGIAVRGAAALASLGYRNVETLQGGTVAWRDAGFELFEGSNVPSKAFGEVVELACQTPALDAEEVQQRIQRGDDLVILDSRPWDEYQDFNIPGGVDCPNSELALHVRDLVPDPETAIVVNCAGRTRSIIGCQTLRNAGVPNPVFALRNGTIGWEWAGLKLEHGAGRRHGKASYGARRWSLAQCDALAARAGVGIFEPGDLDAWRNEGERHSYHIFDVREPEAFAMGSLPGAVSAQGTQLVQATDEYFAVRDARVVLVDDTGVQARMTASWLKQLGHPHVAVLDADVREMAVPHGPVAPPDAPCVAPLEAHGDGWSLLDLSRSLDFLERHPKGALWGLRSDLKALMEKLPEDRHVAVLDDEDGHLAALAVRELEALGRTGRVLFGGTRAWAEAELPVASGCEGMVSAMIDTLDMPFDLTGDADAAKRAYIDWELQLPEQIERDGLLTFSPLT